MNQYVIAFSSFYKAVYAQEKLQEHGIRSTLKKIPPDLLKTCGYALYLNTATIYMPLEILEDAMIDHRGVFEIENDHGRNHYKAIQ